jgi:signal transduction histidine kinase
MLNQKTIAMKKNLLLLAVMLLLLFACNPPIKTDYKHAEDNDQTSSRQEKFEKYMRNFEEATDDVAKLDALIQATIVADDIPEVQDTIRQQLADFAEIAPDCELKVYAYSYLLFSYREKEIAKSFIYFQKAMELIPKFPEYGEILKAQTYTYMAYICSMYAELELAQNYIFEAIPILEALSEKDYPKILEKTSISIYNTLGVAYAAASMIYYFYGNEDKQKEYGKKLLSNAERSDKPTEKATGYLNYAGSIVYDNPDEALEYIEKGYKIALDNQYVICIFKAYDVFSLYEDAIDNIPGAVAWLEKAVEFLKDKHKPYALLNAYQNLAYYYRLTPDGYDKELAICFKELTLADSLQAKNYIAYSHERLKYLYNQKGNYKEAYSHLNKFTKLMEELKSEESVRQINFLTARYDADRREMKISEMEAKDKARKMQLIIGLCVSVVILALLWYMLRLRTRRNRTLAEMNATKDKFFSIISHDLKNPALAQREALQMLVNNASLWSADTLAEYFNELLKSADNQVELLYNLLNWAQVQTGRMVYNPEPFPLSALRPDLAIIHKMAEAKEITFTVDIPDDAIVTGDSNMLAAVIRNLLTNAVKFTPNGGEVRLECLKSEQVNRQTGERANGRMGEKYTISITDTGVGMNETQIRNFFSMGIAHHAHAMGTAKEQGSGLGLIVCKELLEKHGSILHVESEEGRGSRVWFEI